MIHAALIVLFVSAQAGAPPVTSLAEDLRAAVALTTPKERHTAALTIARRRDATIENVLVAIDAALAREAAPAGPSVVRAPIFAEKAVEDVELAVFVPKNYDPAVPAPLIAAFHGTGATGRGQDEMWRETSEK